MAEQTRKNSDMPKDQARKGLTPEVVSVARRRVVKVGLTAPIILTLRSKPLFGQAPAGCSVWMSAAYLSGSYMFSGRPAPVMSQYECAEAEREAQEAATQDPTLTNQ